jgi:hypothetical protein
MIPPLSFAMAAESIEPPDRAVAHRDRRHISVRRQSTVEAWLAAQPRVSHSPTLTINQEGIGRRQGDVVAKQQEFDALQRALRDPDPNTPGWARGIRKGTKPIARWWDDVAERMKATREPEERRQRRALA